MCSQKRKASGGPADASLRTSGYVLDVSVDGFLQFLGALENPVPRASSNPSMGLRSLPATRPDAEYAPIWTSNTRRWREGRIEVKFHRRVLLLQIGAYCASGRVDHGQRSPALRFADARGA